MDYFIYYNLEYEESEIFILISTLSEIQAFKFDGFNFDFYKSFSEKKLLLENNLNLNLSAIDLNENYENNNNNKNKKEEVNFDVGHSYFKVYKNKLRRNLQSDNIKGELNINNGISDCFILIESDFSGKLRFWDFFSGDLLRKIDMNFVGLKSISSFAFMNEKYFLISGASEKMFLLDVNEGDISKGLRKIILKKGAVSNQIFSIKLINLLNYGRVILTYGYNNEINLWNMKIN